MNYLNWLRFDLPTALITLLLAPLGFFLLKIILKYLKDWGSYIIEGILYWVSRFIKSSFAWALTLKRYCRLQLDGESKYLYVPSRNDIKLEIDRVFVTLTLEYLGGQKSTYNHTDILSIGNRIRIVGDPGSGKTSLIKKIFRDACYNAIRNSSKSSLPILVELKSLAIPNRIKSQELGTWMYKKLREDIAKSALYKMTDCFDSYAETSGILVLLDGLDEVSTINYPRVEEAIKKLSEKLSSMSDRNVIIVTMRIQFHQKIKDAYRDSFGPVLFVQPFSPTDIYEFLTRWRFKSDTEQNISRIYKDLTDRPTLREMCSNPLVLSMYVAEDQATGHIVAPESRTEFYSRVTEELLIRRRLVQVGAGPAPTKLREQRERILGKIAYDHLLNANQPANSLLWSSTLRVIREVTHCKRSEAESIFNILATETGLVSEERPRQSIRFIHLTFCEFLAASEAVQGQSNGWTNLIEAHSGFQNHEEPQLHSRLLEVIPFTAGLLPRIKRYEALNDAVQLGDRRLLARCFLETKLYDHPYWQDFVKAESQALLGTPEKNWDEQWLRDLHLFNVVVQDANRCAMHIPIKGGLVDLEAFFKLLVERQQENLSTLLKAYASQDAAAAFRLAEICNLDLAEKFPEIIISNCDQAPFFALVREQALHDLDRIGFWASLLTEAALRSRIVAAWMNKLEPVTLLEKFVEEVSKKKRWHNSLSLNHSLYTQWLTVAVGPRARSVISLPMLNLIRAVPAPGALWRREHLWLYGSATCMLPLIILLSYIRPPVQRPIVTLAITAILYFGLISFILRAGLLRHIYKDALNLRVLSARVDKLVSLPFPLNLLPLNVFHFSRFLLGKKLRSSVGKVMNERESEGDPWVMPYSA